MAIINNGIRIACVDDYNMLILGEKNCDDHIILPPRAYEKIKKFLEYDDYTSCEYIVEIKLVPRGPTDEETGDDFIHACDRQYNCILDPTYPPEDCE